MTFEEFNKETAKRYHTVGDERYGQAFFNVLYQVRPEIADEIRGTSLDPFYTGLSAETYLFVQERW